MYPQNPSFNPSNGALGRRNFWLQEVSEAAILISARKPGGDAEGTVLIARVALINEAAAPQRRIDFDDVAQPWNACMWVDLATANR